MTLGWITFFIDYFCPILSNASIAIKKPTSTQTKAKQVGAALDLCLAVSLTKNVKRSILTSYGTKNIFKSFRNKSSARDEKNSTAG